MPELPEVEVVRTGFAAHCIGKQIASVTVHHPRAVRKLVQSPASFEAELRGIVLHTIARRGKFMWFEVGEQPQAAVVIHLGMSGQLRVFGHPTAEPPRHGRITVTFTDNTQLWFIDQRTFGYWNLSPLIADPHGMRAHIPAQIAHIGPDLLEYPDAFAAAARLQGRNTIVKRALLDQNLISGIGNIYCDEMAWAAQLHPAQPLLQCTPTQLEALTAAGRGIMRAAIAQGGTSFDDLYVNVNGSSGYFDISLHAYGQAGRGCDRCGEIQIKEKIAGRGTVFCPFCQQIC